MTVNERGPQGDHGQRGETGDRGAPGATGYLSRIQVVGFLVLIILVAVVSVYAVRANTERDRRDVLTQRIASCEGSRAILQRFNDQQEALAMIDEKYLWTLTANGTSTPEQMELFTTRVEVYRAGVQPVPDCSLLPRP